MSHPDPKHDPENVKEEDLIAKPTAMQRAADDAIKQANKIHGGEQARADKRANKIY